MARGGRGPVGAWAPWRRARSHGRSPSFILIWEKHWSRPCGVAQAPALFTGSGLTVRPHRPACGNLHCTFKSCFSWFQEPNFFFSKLLLTFHLFSKMESQSPCIDILSNSRRGPPRLAGLTAGTPRSLSPASLGLWKLMQKTVSKKLTVSLSFGKPK